MGRYDAEFFSKLLRGVLTQHAELETVVATHLDRTLDDSVRFEFSVLLIGVYELISHPEFLSSWLSTKR